MKLIIGNKTVEGTPEELARYESLLGNVEFEKNLSKYYKVTVRGKLSKILKEVEGLLVDSLGNSYTFSSQDVEPLEGVTTEELDSMFKEAEMQGVYFIYNGRFNILSVDRKQRFTEEVNKYK